VKGAVLSMLFDELVPFQDHGEDLFLYIRAIPKSRVERPGTMVHDGHGRVRLKVAVHAAPSEGQANQAIVRLLAKELGTAASRIQIVQGQTQRDKTILIRAPDQMLRFRLRNLCLGS
jgi:uncharacterized protein (TIGR00251 family)